MTRTIKASEIKKGMVIQLRVEVDSTLYFGGRIGLHQEDGQRVNVPADFTVEVLREHRPDEPAPGSVVRTTSGDTFCRVEHRSARWQRVGGTGLTWTWNEILSLSSGNPEILFNSEGR